MDFRVKIARFLAPNLKSDVEIKSMITEEIKRAKMMMPITASFDPKGEGYRPLTGGPTGQLRQLSYTDQMRMFEVAYFMYDTSAMLRRLAILDRSFLFGEPFKVKSEDPDVQGIIDRFWNDSENNMDLNFPDHSMWLSLLGEQCWPVMVNSANGFVRLGYVDPSNVKDVFVNPLNVKQVTQVETWGFSGRTGQKFAAIRNDYNINSKTYNRLVGDCFFFSLNHPPNNPRGRSDYLTLFDWIDGLERYGFNHLERAEFMFNFVWDVLLKGMDENQIRDWLSNNPPPEPGSIRAHNENVTWQAVAPDLKTTDFQNGFNTAKGFIMGASGRPDSWFGEGGKAYQTEADQFGQVPIKDLDQRQLYLKYILQTVVQFVIDQAVIAGVLSPEKAAKGFEIQAPEISKIDLAKLVNGIPQLTSALSIAEDNKWIRRDTATHIFAYICSYLGYTVDAEKEIAEAAHILPSEQVDYQAIINAAKGINSGQ